MGENFMLDLKKLIQGKSLSENEVSILHYIVKNIDSVLEKVSGKSPEKITRHPPLS